MRDNFFLNFKLLTLFIFKLALNIKIEFVSGSYLQEFFHHESQNAQALYENRFWANFKKLTMLIFFSGFWKAIQCNKFHENFFRNIKLQ